jgi:hypothetical protein
MYFEHILKHGRVLLENVCIGDYWGKGGRGFTYAQAIQNFDKDERQGPVNFVKDPRFMWHPLIIKAWWSIRKDLRFMILHRNFEEVRQSRARLPKQYDDPARGSESTTKFKTDFADCITMLADLRIPYKIQMFPRYLIDAKPLFRDLKELGMQTCHMEGNKMVQELKDLSKVHFGREIL